MADNAVKALIGDILSEIIEEARDGGGKKTSVGLMAYGSELGQEELCKGARLAQQNDPSVKVYASARNSKATKISTGSRPRLTSTKSRTRWSRLSTKAL